MTSAFEESSVLGSLGESVVREGLKSAFKTVKDVPKNMDLQLEWADCVIVGCKSLGLPHIKCEVKTEKVHTGNLFWEWFSNKELGREGWGQTTNADEIYYLFWDDAIGYRLPNVQQTKWRIDYDKSSFRFIEQKKAIQNNDTWGYLVPISWFAKQDIIQFDFSDLKALINDCDN